MSGNSVKKLRAYGCGFSGLDIIKNGAEEILLPGGTCANVMSVLANLNWEATIIKPKYSDFWNNYIDFTWKGLGVAINNCFYSKSPTPRVIQKLEGNKHHFYTKCPKCGARLLNIALPSESVAEKIVELDHDILYCDRISSGIHHLIEQSNSHGKWVFYEPNNIHSYNTFFSNVAKCDIVKFSDRRISPLVYNKLLADLKNSCAKTKIIIVTHESSGISYSIFRNGKYSAYETVRVEPFKNVVDSSGAGDWLSAGFINSFIEANPMVVSDIDLDAVVTALDKGQAQAEKCCHSVGAIGGLLKDKRTLMPASDPKCQYCKI